MEIDIKPHEKQLIENIQIPDNKVIEDSDYFFRKRIERLFAVSVTFRGVSFKQSEINKCYFRKCNFDSCDFTGASVSSSNFQSSKFTACKFQYATFDKTFIGFDILKKNLPAEENLKAALARSLRVNYLGLGIYDGVNLAIDTEIKATLEHYHKAKERRLTEHMVRSQVALISHKRLVQFNGIAQIISIILLQQAISRQATEY